MSESAMFLAIIILLATTLGGVVGAIFMRLFKVIDHNHEEATARIERNDDATTARMERNDDAVHERITRNDEITHKRIDGYVAEPLCVERRENVG